MKILILPDLTSSFQANAPPLARVLLGTCAAVQLSKGTVAMANSAWRSCWANVFCRLEAGSGVQVVQRAAGLSFNTLSQHESKRNGNNTMTKKHLPQMPNIPHVDDLIGLHHIHPIVLVPSFPLENGISHPLNWQPHRPTAPVLHCGPAEPDRWHESLAINLSPRCTC